MEFFNREIIGGYTVLEILAAVVVFVLAFKLGGWAVGRWQRRRRSEHTRRMTCPNCGWRGEVSRYARQCPQCNRRL